MNNFSIIVPVFYQEDLVSVKTGITGIIASLKELKSPYVGNWEVIVVIDGENQALFEAIKKIELKKIKVYQYKQHQGKGYALLYGFKYAKGDYITFIDCDGDINLKQIFNFFPYLSAADIVIGSKRHPFSDIQYPFTRKILSRGFQVLSFLILGSSLRDTQTGLKIMKRSVLDVISTSIKINHFTFDLELCFLAQKHGFRIVEAPIQIIFQNTSTIKPSSVFKMFWDILRIRFWFSFTRSYQTTFKKKFFK